MPQEARMDEDSKSPVVVPSADGGLEILYLGLDGTEVRFAE